MYNCQEQSKYHTNDSVQSSKNNSNNSRTIVTINVNLFEFSLNPLLIVVPIIFIHFIWSTMSSKVRCKLLA